MKKFFNRALNTQSGSSAFLSLVAFSGGIANAAAATVSKSVDLKTGLTQIFDQILSLSGAFTVAGFITGCWGVFKIIVLIMNHQEDARNNKLSGIIYYMIAAGLGFGFSFSTNMFRGTVWGSGVDQSNIHTDQIFKVKDGSGTAAGAAAP